jgi:hypothetical protein
MNNVFLIDWLGHVWSFAGALVLLVLAVCAGSKALGWLIEEIL